VREFRVLRRTGSAFGHLTDSSSVCERFGRFDGDMASAMVHNPRTWASNKINVPVERILDEAQGTGDLNLSGRRLKEFPRGRKDFALGDTLNAGSLAPIFIYCRRRTHSPIVCLFALSRTSEARVGPLGGLVSGAGLLMAAFWLVSWVRK